MTNNTKNCIDSIVDILEDFGFNNKYGKVSIVFVSGRVQQIKKEEDCIPEDKVIKKETIELIKSVI
ncbi:MAG: hypothetical protein OQK32_01815 [Gammaproteobacteria bacterium]|nr:hypothetical protein [Gammaproteobacteria bacterium]